MKGWRYKLQLFQQGFCALSGHTLFLDLDVVIVDDLDPLFDYAPQSFSIIQDLQAGKQFNSSVFFFEPGSQTHVWQQFAQQPKDVMNCYHGDRDWISERAVSIETWPTSGVVSFKHKVTLEINDLGG
jgi:hypothetical protein